MLQFLSRKKLLMILLIVCFIGCTGNESIYDILAGREYDTVQLFSRGLAKSPETPDETMLWILMYISDVQKDPNMTTGSASRRYEILRRKELKSFGTNITIPNAKTLDEFNAQLLAMYPKAFEKLETINGDRYEILDNYYDILIDMDGKKRFYDYTEFIKQAEAFKKRYNQLYDLAVESETQRLLQEYKKWWDTTKNYNVAEINRLYKKNSVKFLREWKNTSHKVTAKIKSIERRNYRPVLVFYVDKPVYNGFDVVSIVNIVCQVSYEEVESVSVGQTVSFEMNVKYTWNDMLSSDSFYDYNPGDLVAECSIPY